MRAGPFDYARMFDSLKTTNACRLGPVSYRNARALETAGMQIRPSRIAADMTRLPFALPLLAVAACSSNPDPKAICKHVDEIVTANNAKWVGVEDCVAELSLVPEGDKSAWTKELECLGDAKDHPAARKCASWLNTSLYLEHPNAELAGDK